MEIRKPNPDPHPERSEAMEDISPERILWRQIDRYLESEWRGDLNGIHGSLSGLSAIVPDSFKGDDWEKRMSEILDISGVEERSHMQFAEIVKRLDANGKWLKPSPKNVEDGKQWREGFQ